MNEPLAIIGIGCRFPGSANSPQAFWEMLCAGTDAIREIPPDRWSIPAHYDPAPGRDGKSVSRWGGFVDNIDLFDPGFFGISAREADAIDPQQRLLLEVSWEAIEDAGLPLEDIRGSSTGVFVGISTSDYGVLQNEGGGRTMADVYSATGSTFSISANRISYCFDLHGPSLAIDTACSSALTACHVACESIWRGDCSMAIVGGVNALLSQSTFFAFSRMSMLSPDGRCKAFAAGANGFVRAEGAGAILLKPLSAAQASGDRIYAVIRSTAANQDGRTNGITVPSQQAQQDLIRQACVNAGLEASEVAYVEAHGTGTAIGDPIEAAALSSALCVNRKGPCLIGSVKTNIGHLESASGVASLIKVALILKHHIIPPSLHFKKPNPSIDFKNLNLRVVDRLQSFPRNSHPLLAGINSFGFGGANAHVILEAAPSQRVPKSGRLHKPFILPISAHTSEALLAATSNYRALLQQPATDVRSICAAAATRRSHLTHRFCFVGGSRKELLNRLDACLAGERALSGVTTGAEKSGPAFVFSGQGTQWWAMGRQLLTHNAVFRQKIEECDALFREFGNWSLLKELARDRSSSRMNRTEIAQPSIFALQVALAALWHSYGVAPSAVVGHSVGEVAAAHVAGVLTLREAARVIFHRGRAMGAVSDTGRMLAASLNATQAHDLATKYRGEVEVAAFNGPTSITFSGDPASLVHIARELDERGVFNRLLNVNYAFHSYQMDPVRRDLLRALGKIQTSLAQITFYSTVTGKITNGREMTADYWWRNVREPVRFNDAIAGLIAGGHTHFLELSAHPALTVAVAETLAQSESPGNVACSLRRNEPDTRAIFENLAALYRSGLPISWKKVFPGACKDISLPLFPWQRERHWNEPSSSRSVRLDAPTHPFLTVKHDSATLAWHTRLDLDENSWLKDHRIENHIVFPGAGYIEAALGVGANLFSPRQFEIEDVEFLRALHLPEGKDPVELQSSFTQLDSAVTFSSRDSSPGADWNRNAAAKIRARVEAVHRSLDLKRIKANLPEHLSTKEVYATSARRGLFYGPMFQTIDSVWRKDGEALGRVRLPSALISSAAKFHFHPSLLDGCFQLAMISAPPSGDSITFVPVRIDRITVFAPPGPVVFCHATLAHASLLSPVLNFKITDSAGHVLMEVDGYHAQAVRGHTASAQNAPENWLYQTRWIEKSDKPQKSEKARAKTTSARSLTGTWLILADRSGVATSLAAMLKRKGASSRMLYMDDLVRNAKEESDDVHAHLQSQLQKHLAGPDATSFAGILHLWSVDIPNDPNLDAQAMLASQDSGAHSALHLVQAMEPCPSPPPLWLITRQAQCVLPSDTLCVAQSPLLGLGRTIMSELPRLACHLVDVDFEKPASAARCLLRELQTDDRESEVAWRGDIRFASRFSPTRLEIHPPRVPPSTNAAYRLDLPLSGVMDDLALNEVFRRKPGRGEVEVEIHAAALNFRDVMKLLGVYPIESDRDIFIGDECAGRIVALGAGVRSFKVGDKVIACGAGCFASHLTLPASFVLPKPSRVNYEQAATIPVAFMTAWYALHNLARIQRGEKILIHAATGGVGLAAIQIAQLAGAEVFATAGSQEKRNWLRRQGIRHVMDSRTTTFAREISRVTKGAGVDVVLNSLSGEAITKGLSILAPGGRFLEIGKRDIYANTAIGLRPLRNNVSMFVIDMGQVMATQPRTVQVLLLTVLKLFREGSLRPLPHQSLPISRAPAAFRLMAQAKHMGKIILTTQDAHAAPLRMPPVRPIAFSSKASYLITGGLGGFGLSVAKWLVANGARHLVLCGITGAVTPEAKQVIARLRRLGAQILIIKADVSNPGDVANMLAKIKLEMPPIRGVFHAAMVLDDGILTHLNVVRFRSVLAPKAIGAWNLHTALAKVHLDHFVLFSSISALIGTPGQGNYAAANSFLDALAHHRRSLGLPALSINWGALGQVGILARNSTLAKQLSSSGLYPFSPEQATEMLGKLLQRNITQIGFVHADWQKLFGKKVGSPVSPRFSDVVVSTLLDNSATNEDYRSILLAASAEERRSLVLDLVRECVAKVLRTAPAKLDTARPLREMGLDSLMAFELLNRLQTRIGASLPNSKMSANSSIESLSLIVLDTLGVAPTLSKAGKPIRTVPSTNDDRIAPEQQIIPYRSNGTGTPIFLIHPAGGRTSIYEDLAAKLSQHSPVYAIQSRLLSGASEEYTELKELARDYAAMIMQQQPEGAICLAGFSAGGIFALATGRELESSGRKLSLLSMIETPLAMLDPNCTRLSILRSLIVEVYDHLIAGLPASHQRQSRGLSASILKLAQRILRTRSEPARVQQILDFLVERGLLAGKDVDSEMRRFFAAFVRHSILIEQAKIQPVEAPVFLWRAQQSGLSKSTVSPRICAQITRGSFQQEFLNGRHFELMHPPLVDALAQKLHAVLAASLE
ncbi:SDR family NAD(P)-dependent oxidoreductase [Telmatobacter sp. DSM 110680]|uniref:SDR family NAD(P)-dependent oxidoreductase n=1 Tax=Telmatobacter sp. DSM 110680 TaxID=3036704 RepID=A0AAU7DHB7_9BACT